MKNIEYRQDENICYYYIGDDLVCTLDFNTDEFESGYDLTETEKDDYYEEMSQTKADYQHNKSMMTTSYN